MVPNMSKSARKPWVSGVFFNMNGGRESRILPKSRKCLVHLIFWGVYHMSDLCNISRSKLRFTKYLLGIQGTKHLALVSKNHLALDNHLEYYKMGPPRWLLVIDQWGLFL